MVDRCGGVCVGKPDAVAKAEARVAIERCRKRAAEQLFFHQTAQRTALGFHRAAGCAAIPRQARRDTLATEQKRHLECGVDRAIAHQVHAARIAARRAEHAAGIDQRHEDQPQMFQAVVERKVGCQTRKQVFNKVQQHVGADALQAMHAAEKADGGDVAIRVAQAQGVYRHGLPARSAVRLHLTKRARHHTARCAVDQALEPIHLGQALAGAGGGEEGGKRHRAMRARYLCKPSALAILNSVARASALRCVPPQ